MNRLWPILTRILHGLVQAAGMVVLTFFLCRVVPGDVVDLMSLEGGFTPSQADAMREELGLDRSLPLQLLDWVSGALHGDFGTSLRFNRPVADMLLHALPVTLRLAGISFMIGLGLALLLALTATSTRLRLVDRLVDVVNIWSIAVPTFCVGVMGILIFSIWLGWLPVLGSMVLAVFILGIDNAGQIVKPLREELKEAVAMPHVRTARAKGLAPWRIAIAHILPVAAPIVLALSGLILAGLVSGSLTMEVLFGLPGIGSLTLNAIQGRDYPVIMAAITLIAVALVAINTIVDIVHRSIDPRVS